MSHSILHFVSFFLFLMTSSAVASNAASSAAKNTVSFDSKSIIINGKRTLLNVGSIHYPRSTPSMWPHILNNSVKAGINAIDTYVFWNFHEKDGKYDFSLLIKFLRLIRDKYQGLYVVLRIGPYVCAEWNYGGLPTRLKFIEGLEIRANNELFKKEMEKFTKAVVAVVKEFFFTRNSGGPIILLQIENEYGNIQKDYGYSGQDYINWAVNMAKSITTDLPWFVCQQGNVPVVINTCNGFYCHEWIEARRSLYPYNTQPAMFTENWTGWFSRWGDVPPRRPTEDLAYSVALWFAYGGSYNAYYMWHGGTNFGRWAGGPQGDQIGAGFITSYDYDAPLNEYGFKHEPKYSQLSKLNWLLLDYQDYLFEGKRVIFKNYNGTGLDVISYDKEENGRKLVFVINTNEKNNLDYQVSNGEKFVAARWSVSIFLVNENGEMSFLYNTAGIASLPETQNVYSKANMSPLSVLYYAEDLSGWKDSSSVSHYRPREQLSLTKDETDYLTYFYNLSFDSVPQTDIVVEFKSISDFFHLFWNGHLVQARIGGRNLKFTIPKSFLKSVNDVSITTQTLGLTNYGAHLERWERGITDQVFINNRDVSVDSKFWKHFVGNFGERNKVYDVTDESSNSVKWFDLKNNVLDNGFVWYKIEFPPVKNIDLSKQAYVLKMSSMKKGHCWVNGNAIGRYWDIKTKVPKDNSDNGESGLVVEPGVKCDYAGAFYPGKCRDREEGEYSQEYYHVPMEFLRGDVNNFVVVYEEFGGVKPNEVEFYVVSTEELEKLKFQKDN